MIAWIMGMRRLLRRRPFDTSTPEGRSSERYRRIAWSTLLNVAARGTTLVISFVTVPLVLGYLGSERYGMWLTISSLIAVFGPLDLGIGNGLLQSLSEASGRDDRDGARRAVSTGLLLLTSIAAVVAAIALVTARILPWGRVFNVTSPAASAEAAPVAVVLIVIFAFGMPLSVAGVVQSAYQAGFAAAAWAIVASLASLVAILVAIGLQAGLPVLVTAMAGTSVVAAAANAVFLFRRQRPWLAPRLRDFSRAASSRLLRTGLLFIVLQLAGLVAYQLDNVVIAQIMGASAVQQYAIPLKLFSLAPTIVGFGLMPLWPAYREALARGDADWVVRTLRRSVGFALAINVPAALALVLVGPILLSLWVGSAVSPTPVLLVGLGIWTALNSLNGPLAMLLNGADAMRFQAICATGMAVANVAVSVFLVYRIGVAGAVYGSIVAQVAFILAPSAWYVPRVIASVRRSSATDRAGGTAG